MAAVAGLSGGVGPGGRRQASQQLFSSFMKSKLIRNRYKLQVRGGGGVWTGVRSLVVLRGRQDASPCLLPPAASFIKHLNQPCAEQNTAVQQSPV